MAAGKKAVNRQGAAASPRRTTRTRSGLAQALDTRLPTRARVQALASVPDVAATSESFQSVLDLLGDSETPSALRYAALAAAQTAAFNVQAFAAHRTSYLARLRRLRKDPDPEIRTRVMGVLSREKDPTTQEALVDGLKDPAKALIAPEKALQLLGNDIHAGVYAVARQLADNPPNPLARREAMRILATTSESAGYFENILRDKAEPAPIRQLAASSLNQLAPQRLQVAAREMAVDANEDPDVKSLSLTALASFGDLQQLQQDAALQSHVADLKNNASYQGSPLQAAAESFQRRCAT